MCGRYNLKTDGKEIGRLLQATMFDAFESSYNIAPTETIPILVKPKSSDREILPVSWGLIPFWLKDRKDWKIRINARMETVSTNGCFRESFRRRRCLIPMTGFYEWQVAAAGGKQPFEIGTKDGSVFCVGGIWDSWTDGRETRNTACVITCPPNRLMEQIHDRMPVILSKDSWDHWLSDSVDQDYLHSLMTPFPADQMKAVPIATTINNARKQISSFITAFSVLMSFHYRQTRPTSSSVVSFAEIENPWQA